jgi:hypothetical protein
MITPDLVIKGGLELVGGVLKIAKERKAKQPLREREQLCRALRSIYFTPKGVLDLMQDIIDGKKIKPEKIRSVLTKFNDVEWHVARELGMLAYEERFQSLSVSLSTARQLEEIRNGKINVRRAIQEEINSFGQPRRKVDVEALKKLKKDVLKLNKLIEDVDEKLNHQAK